MSKRMKNSLILSLVTICFISCFCVSNMYAKYISVDDTHAVSFDMLANYNVTFDANGGEIISPSGITGRWTSVSTGAAVKVAEIGQPIGELPVASRIGYSFGNWGGANALPFGYKNAEYIECSGQQYFYIGCNNDYLKDQVFTITVKPNALTGYMGSNGDLQLCIDSTNGFAVGKKTTVSLIKPANAYGATYCEGQKKRDLSWNNFAGAIPIYIGSLGGGLSNYTNCKIYGASYELDGKKLRDFVPCYEESNNRFGLYDLVENKFYPSETSTPFTGKLDSQSTPGYDSPSEIMNITSDQYICATWIPNRYQVRLISNGGICPVSSLTVTYDDVFSDLPDPVREGYAFLGWYDGDECYTSSMAVKITEDKTFSAKWAPNSYTVKLNANGGTLDTESLSVTYDECYGSLPTPSLEGFEFAGWYKTNIPKVEYEEVKYIESTGSQYIMTGYLYSREHTVRLTIDSKPTRLGGYMGANGNMQIDYTAGFGFAIDVRDTAVFYREKHASGGTVSCGGKTTAVTHNSPSYDNLMIALTGMGSSKTDVNTTWNTSCRLYGATLEIDGELVRDYIPCRKVGTDEYGLFDLVTKDFFGSSNPSGKYSGGEPVESNVPVTSETIVNVAGDHMLFARWIPVAAGSEGL